MTEGHLNPSATPETKGSSPSATTEDERHQIEATIETQIEEWSRGPDLPAAPARRLEEMVFARAEANPEAPAVARGDEVWSYGRLVRRARSIARHLHTAGVAEGDRVGILCDRQPEMVAAILGVLDAGCAYIPLDPAYPADRLAFMLTDSGASTVLAHGHLTDVLPEMAPRVLALEDIPDSSEGSEPTASAMAPKGPREISRIAYSIYTSGSTGRPKGVAIEHASAAAMLAWAATVYPRDELAGVAAATSICFDLSVFEIFLPLSQGGAVILIDDALGLASYQGPLPVTLLNTVPSGISGLLHLEGLPSSLRVVNLAGEPLRRDLVERIYEIPHVERVFNLYGPSEDTTYSTWSEVEPGADLPVTIGRPIAGTTAHVVDSSLRPVGVEVAGELCLSGAGLARNYHHRPARTAGSFVPNPFSDQPGERMYRTGDLVRWLPDGRLDFLGRIDHQVKLRGFRIELGEIENALTMDPGVEEAVVVVRKAEGSGGDPVLVAYWSPAGEGVDGSELPHTGEPTEGSLNERLGRSLPSYMIPTYFVRLDAFPRTPNGKIDRKALPAPEIARAGLASPYRAPSTPTEEGVAEVWRDLMALDRVGADDDLFALGGHSLMATRIAARLRERFSVALSPTDPFERRTVAELAARIDELLAAGGIVEDDGVPAPPPLVPYDRSQVAQIPLAFPQEQIWLIHRLDPGNLAYNFQYTIRFAGPLRPGVMLGTLNEIIRRHESLRTTFPSVDGEPRQEIHEPYQAEMPVVDLSALPAERREDVAEQLALHLVRHCFDITRLPLMTWTLLRLSEDDHLFVQAEQHFVHDGWSIGRFLGEIETHYAAFAAGEPSPLPPLEVQFADFSLWQRDWLEGAVMEHQLDYWRRRLANPPPALEIPTDRPRSPRQRFRGNRLDLDVAPELYADLLAFGRREGWTLFMLMLTAFEVLMARYSGREDYLLGSGVANRRLKPVEPLIGMVVNTLVLRADVSGEPTFRDLLVRVREAALGLQEHQDLPFEKLVAELQPERDLSRNPLFQHMFSFHDAPVPDLRFADLKGELVERHNGSAKSDFNVIVKPRGSQRMGHAPRPEDQILRVLWEYSTDLFDQTTIERAWGQYNVLLRTLVDHPELEVWHAPLLTPAERQQLTAWNETAPAVEDLDVVSSVLAQARRRPEAPAVVAPDGSITYGELAQRGTRLAERLISWGVRPETTVAVAMKPSTDMVVAFFGILAAGGAYLPLDPDHPADRTAYLLADSGALALLTDEATLAALPDFDGRLSTVSQALAAPPDEVALPAPRPGPDPETLAYVIYTSGTTGRPKGTGVPRRGLSNLIAWHVAEYAVTDADHATQIASPAFDACVWELWPYLTQGAAIHIPTPETRMDPRRLYRWLASEGITLSFVPTALAEEMLELEPPADLALRALLVGGDRLHAPPPAHTPYAVVNHYGPTEDSVVATAGRVESEPTPPPIGNPIDGQRVYLLDGHLEEVPVGVPGQLFIAGSGLARGYLGRPSLTAASFTPHPHALHPGERLYRTGDLARRLPDGSLDFLGRIDNQVQVRGLRIELGEIESQLEEHPKVRRAVVVPLAVAGKEAAGLAAFVLSEAFSREESAESDALPSRLNEHLATQLPSYMVPETITVVPELPQTPNGKVDRKALAERASGRVERTSREGERVAPRDPGERLIAEIWAEVLGVESAGSLSVHDDFFALGGHSLLAAKAAARVGDAFGLDLELPVLFEHRTIARLAGHIGQRSASGEVATPIRKLSEEERQAGLPLSSSQERLWFVDQLIERRSTYHIARTFACRGPLDHEALRAALADIVERHEALRTVFSEGDDGPRQRVVPMTEVKVELGRMDLRPPQPPDRSMCIRETIGRPFDLSQAPLLRAQLLEEGDEEHTLVLVLHHIASDGWSMPNFASELSDHYAARLEGRSAGLMPLPVQYGDFAAWQRERLDGETFERLATFWRSHLEGAPATLEIPTDRPRKEIRSLAGARVSSHLPVEAANALRAQARQQNATLFMALLAAFSALLGRWANQHDVVVGTPVAGRPRRELEDLIGFFVNTLALRTHLGGDPTFEDLLTATRSTTLAAFSHQEMPFEQLVELLAPDRNLSQSPLFQATLALATPGEETPKLAGCEVTSRPVTRHESHFELTLFAGEREDGALDLNFTYDRDLFDPATIERLADHLVRLLHEVAQSPRSPLSQLALMSPAEREQILVEWSGAGRDRELPASENASLHGLVLEQARRQPQSEALVWDGGALTYGELVAQAGALASRLGDAEGGHLAPETPIGVCLERSPELVVSLLAVLMAGGCYVPMDPEYPVERLALLLEDTGAPRVVASPQTANRLPAGTDTVDAPDLAGSVDDGVSWSDENPSSSAGDRLAYILFTSGSTGRPKGVAVPHRGVVRLVRDSDYASFGPQQTYLLAAPAAFDASTFEIWGALANGGRLAVAPSGVLGLDELAECVARHQITTLWLTTGLFHQMVEEHLDDLTGLERLLTGGEVVAPARIAEARTGLPSTTLVNAYGPTESTTFTTYHPMPPGETVDSDRAVPIGRPIARTQVYILDEAMQPVPQGVTGELYIGGAGLARGYWRHPALTAETFVPNPFAPEYSVDESGADESGADESGGQGDRLYRTGDLVRWRPDGAIDFLGRRDGQIKLRGFRIELGEIQAELNNAPRVAQAVVVLRDGDHLAAYVVPAEGAAKDFDTAALRSWLLQRMPRHMVPASFTALDELPLTRRGKVDRAALPEPDSTPSDGTQTVAPRRPLEEKLVNIWQELLNRPRVGVRDDFFALGGHSLLATRLVSRVRDDLGVSIRLHTIFQQPTVEALATAIEEVQGGATESKEKPAATPTIQRASRAGRRRKNPGSSSDGH